METEISNFMSSGYGLYDEAAHSLLKSYVLKYKLKKNQSFKPVYIQLTELQEKCGKLKELEIKESVIIYHRS